MTAFVKPALFAGLCVGCLALDGGAQTSAPPAPATPATAPPTVIRSLPALPGQNWPNNFTPLTVTANGERMYYAYGHGAADVEALKLARQIAEAKSDDDKDKLRDKMHDVLGKAFEERQKRHEKEIEALEAQVKKLREMVAKRSKNKREIIDERIKQLERDAAGLGW